MPGFSSPLGGGKSRVTPGGIPPTKTGLPGRKSTDFEPVLRWVGSFGCLEGIPAKKKDFSIFFSAFFRFFPHIFILKKVSIKLLFTYIHVPNICGSEPAMRGIFSGQGCPQWPPAGGEGSSHGHCASHQFFDAMGRARCQGEARG